MAELTQMDHFDANHVLKFIVNAKGEETFFMDMSYKNKEIKIMYLVSNPDPDVDPIISVFVEDPDKQLIYHRLKKSIGMFTIKTTMKGEHKIIFSNIRNRDKKTVQFAFYNQEEEEAENAVLDDEFEDFKRELLVQKDKEGRELVEALEEDTRGIETQTGNMAALYKTIMSHKEKINDMQIDMSYKQSRYTWLEIVTFIGLAALQVYLIKSTLSSRGLAI